MKDATWELLAKAHRTLEAARRDLEAGDADNAIARAYYAAFQAVTAALHEHDLKAKSHTGTQQLFFEHFVQPGRLERIYSSLFSSLHQMRQEADYAFGTVFRPDRAAAAVQDAEALVEAVKQLLG